MPDTGRPTGRRRPSLETVPIYEDPELPTACPQPVHSREHELKIWPEHFQAVKSGAKTVELRRDDRGGFRVGDVLWLREWDPGTTDYTGDELRVQVTHVLGGGRFGLGLGWVALSIAPVRLVDQPVTMEGVAMTTNPQPYCTVVRAERTQEIAR